MQVNTLEKKPKLTREQLVAVGVCGLYALQLLIEYPDSWLFLAIGAIYLFLKEQNWVVIDNKKMWISLGVAMIPLLINAWAVPSHAVFLTQPQTFFSNSFGGGEYADLINFIFNSGRGIFFILVMIACWEGYQSFQQSGEMGAMARNMVFAMFTIFGLDVISAVIIPAAST